MKTNNSILISVETTAFSGATLLAFLLSSHPEIATVGEISGLIDRNDPETYLCSCKKHIQKCEFWQAIAESMAKKGYGFNVAKFNTKFKFGGPYLLQRFRMGSFRNSFLDTLHDKILFSIPGEKQRFSAMADRNVAFIQSVLEITGRKMLLDTSKSRLRVRALKHFTGTDIRIIHLVRRVEGVVYSHLSREHGADVKKLAKNWRQRHRRFESTFSTWPKEKYIFIRYEDICLDTERVLSGTLGFLGLNASMASMNYQTNSHHVIGNPMRLNPLSEITLDERWKNELSPGQLNEIRQVAGDLNRKYGYSDFSIP